MISDKEIEKTDEMIDSLIDMIDEPKERWFEFGLYRTKLTKYYNSLLKSEK